MHLTAFAGRYATDYIRAILNHLTGMKSPFRARKSLYYHATILSN
jgi:hypothetical protein